MSTAKTRYRVFLVLALWAAGAGAESGFECAGYEMPVPREEAAAKALATARPARGHLRALVIFAGFSDEVERHPRPPDFAAHLFDPSRPGSLTHFYQLMSSGQLQVAGAVLPRRYAADGRGPEYTSADPADPDRVGQYGRFVREVLRRADADVDFGLYDNDGPDGVPNSGDDDGIVDYLFVVPLTTPQGFIRGGATGIMGLGLANGESYYHAQDRAAGGGAIRIGSYLYGSLQRQGNFEQTVGVMAHEFAHALGLPDLYDTAHGAPVEDSAGIGRWGLMGWGAHGWDGHGGPVPFCAWSLERLGWIGPDNERLVEIKGAEQGLEGRDLFEGGSVYKVYLPPGVPPNVPQRDRAWEGPVDQGYLLLETRSRQAHHYNRDLPAEGVLVWHVQPMAYNNADERHKVVDLVCADGLYADAGYPLGARPAPTEGADNLDFWAHDGQYAERHGGNLGDDTDPFDGVRFRALRLAGNPSAHSVGDFSTPALSELELRFERTGDVMRLGVDPPQWAGTIDGEVLWNGRILVGGDVEVAEGGGLFIKRGTQVWLAAGEGGKPVQVRVRGELHLVAHFSRGGPVVFEGVDATTRWHGIALGEGVAEPPLGGLELRGAERGLFRQVAAPVEGVPRLASVSGAGGQRGLEVVRPGVFVENGGPGRAAGWTATYQVLRDGRMEAEFSAPVPELEARQKRPVLLPAWRPVEEGDYALRFALSRAGKEEPESLWQSLQVVDLGGRFIGVELSGASRANGVGFFDYDGDGDADLYLVRSGEANALYRNDGGAFIEVGRAAGADDAGRGRGLAVGDYDGDGDLDLYLVNEGTDRLLVNGGDGRFRDASAALPEGSRRSGRDAGFFDYDGDGDLDLYLVNAVGPNQLFANDGGRFSERAAEAGLADEGYGRGLAIGDYDGDGDGDLFVTNQYGLARSQLYENRGGRFAGVGQILGLRASGREVAAVFGDYDGDGDLDLFFSNQEGANELWSNHSGWVFRREAAAVGERSLGAAFLDYDNDGDLDLVTTSFSADGSGEQVFHNRGGAGFVAVGERLGLRAAGRGSAIAFGDFDEDGRQDLAVAAYGQTRLFRNGLREARWLQLELRGADGNAYGLGARVELVVADQLQMRESYGYGSQIQPNLHFGLGRSGRVDSLRVVWPDGQQSVQTGIRANQRLVLIQSQTPAAKPTGAETEGLGANFPNPFNAATAIPLRLEREGRVLLEIYNMAGQRIRVLVDKTLPPGVHRVDWDGRDGAGRRAASGMYIYRLRGGGADQSRRLLLLR